MSEMTYSSWIADKAKMAVTISGGCCGGTYAEGALILCAAISAMAACWRPGGAIDRKRFIEATVCFRGGEADPTMVSGPLLAHKSDPWRQRLKVSRKSFYLTGSQDKPESEVLDLCGGASASLKKEIRKYSYASLLYQEVRCGFVHEYRVGRKAAEDDSLRSVFNVESSEISYVNRQSSGAVMPSRHIHFPLDWIARIAASIARGLDAECMRQNKRIFEELDGKQSLWWIDGA
jgi:hypothetical protein